MIVLIRLRIQRFLVWAASLVCLLAIGACSNHHDAVQEAETSVLRVVAATPNGDGHGTAFAINHDGTYVTNYHVVQSVLEAEGDFLLAIVGSTRREGMHDVEIVAASSEHDLAILQSRDLKRDPLSLSDASTVRKTQRVYALGFPGVADVHDPESPSFLEPTITEGTITNRQSRQDMGDVFVTDATINPGNSGGPLIDSCGRVVGVNTAGVLAHAGHQTFFAVRVNVLKRFLESEDIAFRYERGPCREPLISGLSTLWIGLGVIATLLLAFSLYFARRVQSLAAGHPVTSEVVRRALDEVNPSRLFSTRSSKPKRAPALDPVVCKIYGFDRAGHPVDAVITSDVIESVDGAVIGRHPSFCDLVLDDSDVSKRHIRVFRNDSDVFLEDLNSSNGSDFDGQALKAFQPQRLSGRHRVIIAGLELSLEIIS